MKGLIAVLCALLALPVLAEEPQVLVETSLQPTASVVVGGTVRLQVDVLVDTWFTQAPQLPSLNLPGAVVMPPSSESLNLTETRLGKTFFGLRFSYLIIPQQVQAFSIPALTIQVSPGQASAPTTAHTTPQSFSARQPAGFTEGQAVLVAQAVRLSQQVSYSNAASRVGDTVTRQVTLEADGGQSMLLPETPLGDVDGLRRYAQTPRISPLSDGRGGISGGQRVDSASYRIERAGHFSLPAVQVRWWDSTANQARTASLPAIVFEATANADYHPPFSITADLQALGQKTRVHLARHWLLLAGGLIALGLLAWWGRPACQRLFAAWQGRRAQRRARWLASAEYAWQQIPGQLDARPAQLTALYLWARRKQHTLGLLELPLPSPLAKRLLGFLNARYGSTPALDPALQQCKQELPALLESIEKGHPQPPRPHGLRPLNPGSTMPLKERP
jgi:hypothetical protein